MVKFQIDLHDEHFTLLEAMAKDEYREVKGQVAWLIGCAVSGWAVLQQEPAPLPTGEAQEG